MAEKGIVKRSYEIYIIIQGETTENSTSRSVCKGLFIPRYYVLNDKKLPIFQKAFAFKLHSLYFLIPTVSRIDTGH